MTSERLGFDRVTPGGVRERITRAIAIERPVAIEINGFGYAVMMASPADLEDFVTGFLLSERLADRAGDLLDLDTHATDAGIILRVTLVAERGDRVTDRVRHRTTDSSCGLCGIENLEAALRPLPPVREATRADEAAVFRALDELRTHQRLNAETGAVHAAAHCSPEGEVLLVREDVGRHNAFDKLIGAMARAGQGWDGGFALLSSRCSYELVEKAALAGCPMLATISAPTSLAVARAREAGLRLIVLARADALLELP